MLQNCVFIFLKFFIDFKESDLKKSGPVSEQNAFRFISSDLNLILIVFFRLYINPTFKLVNV